MNVLGAWQTVTFTGTTSDEVDLGRDWARVLVLIPTITSASIYISVAKESGGDFYIMCQLSATGIGSFLLATAAETQTKAVIFPCGVQHMKVVSGASQTAETFYVRGLD